MTRTATILLSVAALLGCDDPSEDVSAATVSESTSTPTQPSPEPVRTEALTFSNEGSSIEFVGSKVTGSHEGSFGEFTGTLHLAEPLSASRVRVSIQTASLTADDGRLTEHLKSDDFFDVESHPTATFRSTQIVEGAEGSATHTVTGELTLHGQTRTISFPATISVGPERVRTQAEFSIDRRDFGIDYDGMANDLIRDGVVIRLDIVAPRSNPA